MLHANVSVVTLALGLALAACGNPAGSNDATVVEPIDITSVEVTILEIFPALVDAHVTGVVGDGCSTLLPIEQSRVENQVTVTIKRERRIEGACTLLAQLFDQTIRLQGTFLPGEYLLTVNTVDTPFGVS